MTRILLAFAVLAALALAIFWPRRGIVSRLARARRLGRRSLIEDALKHIHARETRGALATAESLAGHLGTGMKRALELLHTLEERRLARSTGTGLRLTDPGRRLARRVIRAHRLLERYLADELRMPLERIHSTADRREHTLSAEQVAELEARLGYPRRDPHGDPIPSSTGALELIEASALTDWAVGEPARIVHLEDEPPEALAAIVEAGFALGMHIEIRRVSRQRLVIWDGETERELPPRLAANVFVAPLEEAVRPPPKLSSLEPGKSARVLALRTEGLSRRRLLDLGLTPGTIVECVSRGPFGEPTSYRVRGAVIGLRREQTETVDIEPLPDAASGQGPS